MKLILATMLVSVALGSAAGGRLTNLTSVRIRWAPLAAAIGAAWKN